MIIGTIALLTILLSGGSAFSMDDFRSAIKETIVDKGRQKQAIDVTKRIDNELSDYSDHRKKTNDRVVEAFRDYDLSREDLDTMLDREEWRRKKVQERVMDARFEVISLVTQDEWTALYDLAIAKAKAD